VQKTKPVLEFGLIGEPYLHFFGRLLRSET